MPGYAALYLAGVNWGHYLVNAETSFRAHYKHIAKDFRELNAPLNKMETDGKGPVIDLVVLLTVERLFLMQ